VIDGKFRKFRSIFYKYIIFYKNILNMRNKKKVTNQNIKEYDDIFGERYFCEE